MGRQFRDDHGGHVCEAAAFNADISAWDTSSVTTMEGFVYEATSLNADISAWDTSSVTTMYFMFWGATAFNADISWLGIPALVADMSHMFYEATLFNADISGWDTQLPCGGCTDSSTDNAFDQCNFYRGHTGLERSTRDISGRECF